jgi:hypothetical protein
MGKGIGKGVYEIRSEGFIAFGDWVAPSCGFLSENVGLFFHPIVYFVSIKKSQEVGTPLIRVLYMRIVLIIHLEQCEGIYEFGCFGSVAVKGIGYLPFEISI